MSRVGGLTHRFYKETRGVKVSGGQAVKAGTVLTREGNKWKAGLNVSGRDHLTASCDGEIFFTRKKSRYNRLQTVINIRPLEVKTKKSKVKSQN